MTARIYEFPSGKRLETPLTETSPDDLSPTGRAVLESRREDLERQLRVVYKQLGYHALYKPGQLMFPEEGPGDDGA